MASKPKKAPASKTFGIALGAQVPDFSLAGTDGQFQLSQNLGKKILLYFYPKDKTPGCTIEGHEFSKLKGEFDSLNVKIYGVSRDTLESHQDFKDCESYAVDLLADTEEKACKIFDVVHEKNMYGKKVWGIVRSTFLVDEQGRLIQEWRGVQAAGHAQHVLDSIKAIS